MNRPSAHAFVAGGTVQAGGGVYLERSADRDLLEHCRAGDFSYILTSRQMGKSSLMIRTAERLTAEGVLPVIVDLTEFGAQTSAEQWYKGFLTVVQDTLSLKTPVSAWWATQADHAFGHRFTRYLREVVLAERSERLVIFVDEIDTTLRLNFTDDFFTAIRFLYQLRAVDATLQRLSFVLIGVATPGDLIKDVARTPFNIGHRIELTDFTAEEAQALTTHLAVPAPYDRDLVAWTMRWTGGHPYLTLRTIRSLAESPPPEWTAEAVDERINALFFREGGETDSNLQFVRDMLTKKAFDREAVLRTYGRARRGEQVPDQELDLVTSWLKLSGVVCRREGWLRVRNAIYEEVFDERWVRDHLRLNVNWRRRLSRLAAGLVLLVVLALIPIAIYAWQQKTEAEHQTLLVEIERDEAKRQRNVAERAADEFRALYKAALSATAELKQYDAASAAAITEEVTSAHQSYEKNMAEMTAPDRTEPNATAPRRPAGSRTTPPAPRTAAPPAPAPPPKDPRLAADEAAIQQLFQVYESAHAQKNIEAIRKVQELNRTEVASLTADFAAATDYRVDVDIFDFKFFQDGRRAEVRTQRKVFAIVNNQYVEKPAIVVFTVEKRSGGWRIISVQVSPK